MGDECYPALVADFHRYYGLSLRSMRDWGIPLTEVAAMAMHLPPDSATRRALDPHWQRTMELDMLREVEHDIRILLWQNANSGKRVTSALPQPIPLPWDPKPRGTIEVDRMTTDEADKWLGWDKLKEERRGS